MQHTITLSDYMMKFCNDFKILEGQEKKDEIADALKTEKKHYVAEFKKFAAKFISMKPNCTLVSLSDNEFIYSTQN